MNKIYMRTTCLACGERFKTDRDKFAGEEYSCDKCGAKHVTFHDEVDACWDKKLVGEGNGNV